MKTYRKGRTEAQKAKRRAAYPVRHKYPKGGDGVHDPAAVISYIKQWCKLNGPYKPTTYIVAGQEVTA